ncbi:hypothetical protein PPERSA_09340 [Pseudocohnilembus persalinus]|uniref:Uncharacterized protein n=1 Tax=Pseudocohnilembus persalinus TaxID=266149 RepID=A0A0V0QY08_PSEPJ|nr:hypothetical protein PPERSA_09340 [Pseudocohnilembus persalinus]|eukprot:KRX07126.1 hypothetical protein PPERSA_09340 [Pseudocohnilembus persalinus]
MSSVSASASKEFQQSQSKSNEEQNCQIYIKEKQNTDQNEQIERQNILNENSKIQNQKIIKNSSNSKPKVELKPINLENLDDQSNDQKADLVNGLQLIKSSDNFQDSSISQNFINEILNDSLIQKQYNINLNNVQNENDEENSESEQDSPTNIEELFPIYEQYECQNLLQKLELQIKENDKMLQTDPLMFYNPFLEQQFQNQETDYKINKSLFENQNQNNHHKIRHIKQNSTQNFANLPIHHQKSHPSIQEEQEEEKKESFQVIQVNQDNQDNQSQNQVQNLNQIQNKNQNQEKCIIQSQLNINSINKSPQSNTHSQAYNSGIIEQQIGNGISEPLEIDSIKGHNQLNISDYSNNNNNNNFISNQQYLIQLRDQLIQDKKQLENQYVDILEDLRSKERKMNDYVNSINKENEHMKKLEEKINQKQQVINQMKQAIEQFKENKSFTNQIFSYQLDTEN